MHKLSRDICKWQQAKKEEKGDEDAFHVNKSNHQKAENEEEVSPMERNPFTLNK